MVNVGQSTLPSQLQTAPAEIDPTAEADDPPPPGDAGPPMAKAKIDEIMAKIAAHHLLQIHHDLWHFDRAPAEERDALN